MKMIKSPHTPPDDLDRLLSQVKRPEPPAWFEARLMARLRQEKEKDAARWWVFQARPLAFLGALTAVVLIGACLQLTGVFTPVQPVVATATPAPAVEGMGLTNSNKFQVVQLTQEDNSTTTSSDDKITDGLNAFMNYSDEEELWSDATTSL